MSFPFKLGDKYEVKLKVGDVECVKKLNHGYPPDIVGNKMIFSKDTYLNFCNYDDDTIHSIDHFKECVDRAFREAFEELFDSGVPVHGNPECKKDFVLPYCHINITHPVVTEVYFNNHVVEVLKLDKSRLFKYPGGWYRNRQLV